MDLKKLIVNKFKAANREKYDQFVKEAMGRQYAVETRNSVDLKL